MLGFGLVRVCLVVVWVVVFFSFWAWLVGLGLVVYLGLLLLLGCCVLGVRSVSVIVVYCFISIVWFY